MNLRHALVLLFCTALLGLPGCSPSSGPGGEGKASSYLPGSRVLVDAHNCYPYEGQWANRIERALSTGVPLAIEQDLAWFTDPDTGESRSLVVHERPFTGKEPSLRDYFFERIRPIVERALADGDKRDWPLITLNLDFKTAEPEHLAAIWQLLGEYEDWLTTAERGSDPAKLAPLDLKPVLVLTGESDAQERAFYDDVPADGRLRLFGAVRVNRGQQDSPEQSWEYSVNTPPETLVPPSSATNYRRWWNNSWFFVEQGGATRSGDWTSQDEQRLAALVQYAHAQNLWIRFYTLDGFNPADTSQGWGAGYNFGSRERAETRWRAAIAAGVDFIATDQYEDLAGVLKESR